MKHRINQKKHRSYDSLDYMTNAIMFVFQNLYNEIIVFNSV